MSEGKDKSVDIEITADGAKFEQKLQDAAKSVQKAVATMNEHFKKLSDVMETINGKMALLGAILAGGKAFKESINAVKEQNSEAIGLSRSLGITAEEANVLNHALKNVFLDKDVYIEAVKILTKQINTNGDAFKKLGISTRDASGHLLPMQDIIQTTVERLKDFKEGTDRNTMAQQLLGKSWQDVMQLAKLNDKAFEEAREEIAKYHEELNPKMVADYKHALKEVNNAFEAIGLTIGRFAMPIFTDVGNWLAVVGPAANEAMMAAMDLLTVAWESLRDVVVEFWTVLSDQCSGIVEVLHWAFGEESLSILQFFANVLKVVELALVSLRVGFQVCFDVIGAVLKHALDIIGDFASYVNAVLTFDFKGMESAWKKGFNDLADAAGDAWDKIKVHAKKGQQDLIDIATKTVGSRSIPALDQSKKGSEEAIDLSKDKKPKSDKSRVSGWEGKLDEQRVALEKQNEEQGKFYTMSKAEEAAYWAAILKRHDLSKEERLTVEKKYYALVSEQRRADFDAHIAHLKTEMDAFKNNMDARLGIAQQIAADMKQKFGASSKEYEEAQQEIIRIEHEKAAQIVAVNQEIANAHRAAALAEIDAAEQAAQFQLERQLITQGQMEEKKLEFEQRRYDIDRQALQQRLNLMAADPDMNPVEYQKLIDQLLEIDRKHEQDKLQIKQQMQVGAGKPMNNVFDSMQSSFEGAMNGILTKSETSRQALQNIWKATGRTFVDEMVTKPMVQFLMMETRKTAAALLGITTRTGAEATGAATSTATNSGAAAINIMNSAYESMAGAFKAMVGIPYIGPFLAVGAGAAAFAAVAGIVGKLKSASGGFDIPSGMNPVTQLHQEEMVLPAHLANAVRNMATGGGSGASGGGGGGMHVHVHSMDSQDVVRALQKGGAVHVALTSMQRRFQT